MNGLVTTIIAVVIVAVVVAIAAFYFGGVWERQRQTGQPSGRASGESTPFAYRLVLFSVLGVIAAFLVVMLAFAAFGIFKEGDAANAAAALSEPFKTTGSG